MRRKFLIIILLSVMAVLIIDNKTVLCAAQEGIVICMQTVIPVLFPFIVISTLLANTLFGIKIPILTRIGRVMHMPSGVEMLWIIGLLGGYPAGAQCVSIAVQSGGISSEDGKRLLGICNNAGPAFIFGFGMHIFPDLRFCLLIWLIQILSSITIGFLIPAESSNGRIQSNVIKIPIATALKKAITSMAMICGWVLLFGIVMDLLEKWILWFVPSDAQILLCGLLEITNGCSRLMTIPSIATRFVYLSLFLSFGGLCVAMQTFAVSSVNNGLYLLEKLLQALVSTLLSTLIAIFLFREWPACIIVCTVLSTIGISILGLLYKKKLQKTVAFKEQILYNPIRQHTR